MNTYDDVMSNKCHTCDYCGGNFEQLEQPVFYEDNKAVHATCVKQYDLLIVQAPSYRTRLIAIANAAETQAHPRFVIRRYEHSLHIKLDGWDVGSMNAKELGANSSQITLAETILGLS